MYVYRIFWKNRFAYCNSAKKTVTPYRGKRYPFTSRICDSLDRLIWSNDHWLPKILRLLC